MTDILFTANGASATALVSGELTSGMVGLPVRFSFDSDWDGLNIVAVFDGGGHRISVPLLTDMEAVLPWEVIAKANTRLRIGAEGRKSDGSVVIPTVWANAGYITEGAVATDEEGNPPTPGIYDQIMAAIEAGQLQGEPGDDGVSPTVSVTEIEGGHRVTIKDAIGTKTFDVMNGKDAIVNIVDNLGSSDPNSALSARMGGVLKAKIEEDVSALNEQLQPQINQRVKTVNGVAPDKNGNVNVEGGGGGKPVELDTTLSVSGKAADAKAVGDALENVNATNIYIGENTNTTVDEDGNVTTMEGGSGSGGSGSGGSVSSAEWQHLATVDFADESNQLQSTEFTELNNITEIFVKLNGVQSSNESTASNFYLSVNGKQIAMNILPINKKGTVQYTWFYAKYNGLVWLPIKPASAAISDTNFGQNNLQVPYSLIFGVGAATEFVLAVANVAYKPVTGTLEVYVR